MAIILIILGTHSCRKLTFDPLLKQVLRSLKGQRAILDGEIVVLDEKGLSNFYDLMAHRGEPRYYAFDLLWLNGIDLRPRPLLDRKRRLHRLIPANDSHLLYVEHLDGDGQRFFELACEQDLEGIICKPKTSPYPFTWIKVKTRTILMPPTGANGSIGHEHKP